MFLAWERDTMCRFRQRGVCEEVDRQMTVLSNEIKAAFPSEKFDYHGVHIEMKKCVGSAPSNNFTTEALCKAVGSK